MYVNNLFIDSEIYVADFHFVAILPHNEKEASIVKFNQGVGGTGDVKKIFFFIDSKTYSFTP